MMRYPGGLSKQELETRLRRMQSDITAMASRRATEVASRTVQAAVANVIDTISFGNITGVPLTFPPSAHTHTESEIVDLDKYTQAEVDALLAAVATELDDLTDVDTVGALDDDVLTFDDGQWVPKAPTGGGGGGPVDAEDVDYDSTASGLTATDVQAAIDELAATGGGGVIALEDGLVVVQHGSNASEARPSAAGVYWQGSVAPTNRALGDLWLETSAFD